MQDPAMLSLWQAAEKQRAIDQAAAAKSAKEVEAKWLEPQRKKPLTAAMIAAMVTAPDGTALPGAPGNKVDHSAPWWVALVALRLNALET